MDTLTCAVECRASESGPVLRGVLLREGTAARGGRAELFTPGALTWPADGVDVRLVHLGPAETRAAVERDGTEVRITAPATPAIFAAVEAGRRFLSVEFHALAETRTAGGVRETARARVAGAALVPNPEYGGTAAEVRSRRRRWVYV